MLRCILQSIYCLTLFAAWSATATASELPDNKLPTVVFSGDGAQNITTQAEFYKDSSGNLSINQIRDLPSYIWQSNDQDTLRFGFTDDTYWLRLKISNQANEPILLVANEPLFDTIDAYVLETGLQNPQLTSGKAGLVVPPQDRPTSYRLPTFQLGSKSEMTVWLRTKTTGSYVLVLYLDEEAAYLDKEAHQMLFYGGYFGALAFATLLFFVVALAVKHNAIFALGVLTLCSGLSQLTVLGIFANELWEPNLLYRNSLSFSVSGALIAVYFFFSHSLNLRDESPIAEWILRIIAAVALFALTTTTFIGHQNTILVTTSLSVLATVTTLAASLHLAWRGNRFAVFTAFASSAILLSNMQHALVELQLVPVYFASNSATYYGFLIMIFILTVGLGFEIRNRQTKLDAQTVLRAQERAQLQAETNAVLETQVQNRTQELEDALTDLAEANEALTLLNTVDQVTTVNNRYHFDTSFEQEWKRASRERYPLSLLMVDVDHFKKVNDTYGHVVGDACLRAIAQRIDQNIKRASDMLARFGGEEFVVLLPYSDNEHALVLAEKIRSDSEKSPIIVDDIELQIRLSVGVCTVIPNEADSPKDLITSADLALYEAKSSGRNKVCNAGNLTVHKNLSA